MKHYIDKDALMTRIKKLKMDIGNIFNEYDEGFWEGRTTAFDDVICALDTLEMKEVDLEKEVKDYIYTLPHSRTGIPGGWKCSWPEEEVIKIVKHFLNLD